MGLAPAWLQRGLNLAEQHWVSACMLARTNYFGKHIEISMRAPNTDFDSLQITQNEEEDFIIFEGGFFGNIFLENPVGFVCQGDQIDDEILKLRVCTAEARTSIPSGEKLSLCNFIIVGNCDQKPSFTMGGVEYSEIIRVFLKPGLKSIKN